MPCRIRVPGEPADENIAARRLNTIMERLLEEFSSTPPKRLFSLEIDAAYVKQRLDEVTKDEDLSKFIDRALASSEAKTASIVDDYFEPARTNRSRFDFALLGDRTRACSSTAIARFPLPPRALASRYARFGVVIACSWQSIRVRRRP